MVFTADPESARASNVISVAARIVGYLVGGFAQIARVRAATRSSSSCSAITISLS
jgi:hypothetical protein